MRNEKKLKLGFEGVLKVWGCAVRGLKILCLCLLCFCTSQLYADFGFFVQGEFEVAAPENQAVSGSQSASADDKAGISGSVIFAPWLSVPLGRMELNASAGVNVNIAKETVFAPELYQLELLAPLSPLFSFRLGRFTWQDASGFTANGRFDVAELLFDFEKTRLGFSALYTGFLFKDTSKINVSPSDTKDYGAAFKWDNFADTYAAPRRVMASLY